MSVSKIHLFARCCGARVCVALLLTGAPARSFSAAPVAADHAAQMAKGTQLFNERVAALLEQNCLKCHGGRKTEGDFDLSTREGLLHPGADGPLVIAGDARESLLFKLITHAEKPHMPRKADKLPDDAIAAIATWIDAGAPYAKPLVEKSAAPKGRPVVTDEDRRFWSFEPLARVAPPPVKDAAWARTPIDRFILAKLDEKGIRPNPPVDKRELVRRVYFDLIGLPPTPAEIDGFVNDTSPDAYEKLIDRLLASPHYGERWGRHWLDLARFGESHGYEQDYDRPFAYHYRDFVIRALNADMPYDQFVKWQIAGDELAPDRALAWMATGFLGAGTHATQITANQAEKERYDELDDQISTIGTAMLGLTVGCARCHDHKFDPIPTQDYYRLISTFTTTVRSDQDLDLDAAKTREALAAWEREHKPLSEALKDFEKARLPERLETWLKADPQLPQPDWLALDLDGVKCTTTQFFINDKTEREAGGTWILNLGPGESHTLQFTVKTALTGLAALRIELDAAPQPNGATFPPDLTVESKGKQTATLKFTKRTSRSSTDTVAIYDCAKPFGVEGGGTFTFKIPLRGAGERTVQTRVRIAATHSKEAAPDSPALVSAKDFEKAQAAFLQPQEKWNAAQREAVSQVFRASDADWRTLRLAVEDHAAKQPRPQLVKAMVCSEGVPAIRLHTQGPDFYEKTYILKRGDLNQKQTEAEQGFLQVLMRAPEREKRWPATASEKARTPRLRSALGNWLTDVDYGAGNLLARVIVNRLWQHHLGRGIVATPSDFGATGSAPTHPELLDWLAGELIQNGWRLKQLHKQIMMSAVYLQGTGTDGTRMAADPENLLFWHRPRQRLDAEIIRDAVLAVSGRLDATMFGPGSLDETMTRRSIYFTIKRSNLIPMMVQFDAPDSLQGIGRRVNTTIAPQALLLMNNAQIRAAAGAFAKRLKPTADHSLSDAVKSAYLFAVGREPSKVELTDSLGFIQSQAATYPNGSGMELALTDFCQAVLGLNEFVYVE